MNLKIFFTGTKLKCIIVFESLYITELNQLYIFVHKLVPGGKMEYLQPDYLW